MREGEKYLCVIREVTGDPPETLTPAEETRNFQKEDEIILHFVPGCFSLPWYTWYRIA